MSERVVVAAPYPTMPGPEAAATFALVRRLVDSGDDVTVVSPAPSAAHHHADPGGPRGALRLARLVSGADRLVLRLDAAALRAGGDDRRLLPGRLALRRAIGGVSRVDIRLDRVPTPVHPRFAGLVLRAAARITVATEAERDALMAAGIDPLRVVVEPEDASSGASDVAARRAVVDATAAPPADAVSAESLEALLRTRAAAVRASTERRQAPAEGTASLPLRHLVRMERAQVRSAKPGGAFAKRAIAKALAWQFDNVIQHVNQLHQATIDAIDNLEAERQDAPEETTS